MPPIPVFLVVLMQDIQQALRSHGLKASTPRVAILRYLRSVDTHPTAEKIHEVLLPTMKTLSLGTVYNTLRTFQSCGLASELTIQKGESRYDGNISPHGHFSCSVCGELYDIPLQLHSHRVPEGFQVDSHQHFFYGCCPNCATRTT